MILKKATRIIFYTVLVSISFSFKAFNNTPNSSTASDNRAVKWNNYVSSLYGSLSGEKAGLKYEVFQKALVGYYNLKNQNKLSSKNLLTIVDFSLPSNKKRLWIVNIETKSVLYNSLVSHGRNTGTTLAKNFSNQPETYKSSLGFYVTGKTYHGKHDLSLRLIGMDASFNDKAFERAIVMHGAKYVSESWIKQNGMLGRSHGCPAIPMEITKEVIPLLADGTCLFLYSPDKDYTTKSALLNEGTILDAFNALNPEGVMQYHLK